MQISSSATSPSADRPVSSSTSSMAAFAVLSGSGILDDVIEEAIDTAVCRFGVGEKYYRPILDMKYDGCGGDLWWVIEKKICIEHSQRAERHKEVLLAVGLAFFTEIYEYCIIFMPHPLFLFEARRASKGSVFVPSDTIT